MRMSGSDGSLFEMRVAGYQFPAIQDEVYDSNWLLIRIHVVQSRGEWTSVDPCMLTDELEALANWFDAGARGDQVDAEQHFIEPNLSFRLRDQGANGRSLAIYLALDCWAKSEAAPVDDRFVLFPLAEVEPARAAAELRGELARYPQRAVR
jgi:hypothetical protein